MVKQLHDLKLNTPLYANLVPGSAVVREALGTLDEGVVYSDLPIATDSLHKDAKIIYEALLAKYGPRRSAPILSLLAIDSLRILDRALQSGKPPAEYIRSTTFPGLVGDLAFDSHGAVIGLAYSLRRIQAQQSVPVKE